MMDCKRITKILPAYVEGALPAKLNTKVKQHLDTCADCSVLYNKLTKTISLLKPAKEIGEQPFYYTRLKQKMENNPVKKSVLKGVLQRKVLQPAIYLASLILAVYIGILIGSSPNYVTAESNSELKNEGQDYIQAFAEYQYLNDFEIEPVESLFSEDSVSLQEK